MKGADVSALVLIVVVDREPRAAADVVLKDVEAQLSFSQSVLPKHARPLDSRVSGHAVERVARTRLKGRRVLNQAANAAVKTKGSIFDLGTAVSSSVSDTRKTIGAIAHRLCRLVWKILHEGVACEERGPAVTKQRQQARAATMIRELRSLGYCVVPG